MMMKKSLLHIMASLAIAGMAFATSTTALAVQSYGNLAAPGVYFGSGNANGDFTIDTSNGIELGLRAKDRETLAVLDGSTGTYYANPGLYNGVGPKKKWNYEFSANTGGVALQNFTFMLGVDHDPTAGTAYSWVDPSTYWGDNAFAVGSNGFQNSENPGFADTPGGVFGGTAGLYTFDLQAWSRDGQTLLAETKMNVQVVPEPETYTLMLAGLASIGFVAKRRKQGDQRVLIANS
jgi:hypothetical protein